MKTEKKSFIQLIPYFSLVFFILLFSILQIILAKDGGMIPLSGIFSGGQQEIFFSGLKTFVSFLLIALFVKIVITYWEIVRHGGGMDTFLRKAREFPGEVSEILKKTSDSFAIIVLNLLFVPLIIRQANALSAGRLWDDIWNSADKLLTGVYPWISLGNIEYPSWFLKFTEFSYFQIGAFLLLFACYLLYKKPKLYDRFLAAFFLTFIILPFFWFFTPTIAPFDRYIKNVFDLPIPRGVEIALESYSPQSEIRRIHDEWTIISVTAFPSAHIIWLVFLGVFSYRAGKKIFLFSLPFILFSAFGTVLFAVHYFSDVIGGILIAVGGIWVVGRLEKIQGD